MSWGHPRELMDAVDDRWTEERVLNGLASGEGLIHAVRDRVTKGEDEEGDEFVLDVGVLDKRLLVSEGSPVSPGGWRP